MELYKIKFYSNHSDKSISNDRQIGLIAQDVEKVFPEAFVEDSNGIKAVNYNGLVGALVEGMKELKTENDQKSVEITELKAIICLDNHDKSICQ